VTHARDSPPVDGSGVRDENEIEELLLAIHKSFVIDACFT